MSLSYQPHSLHPQALSTGFTSRLSKDLGCALIITTVPQERSAKRNAQQINYAEFDNVNEDFEIEEEKLAPSSYPSANTHNVSAVQKHLLKAAKIARGQGNLIDDDLLAKPVKYGSGPLIPMKLSIEYNGGMSKLVDFFMWDLSDVILTPDRFASLLCNELELPQTVHLEIVDSINKQIEDYSFLSTLQLPATSEYHVVVELSVNLDKQLYEDKFEWDLNQEDVLPEDFADIVVSDMGLSLEFKPAIAHSLHEMAIRLKKEIFDGTYNVELQKYQQLTGLIFERNVRIRTDSSIHNGNAVWEPFIEILSPWEIEKREIERERNIRRLKRENMRREVDDFTGSKRRATARRRLDELDWRI